MEYYTVSQVGEFVSNIFKSEVLLHNILVFGEVSGFKISQNHAYFTLKDENAQLACSCFNYRKTYVPKDGETVIIKCSPNYYSKGGRLSFIVDFIEPKGKGDLYQKIEELKKKLFAEGLFEESRKKPIPMYPENVGVVTSKTGAVIQDIYRTVRRKNKNLNLLLVDTKVQGVGAVEELIQGINMLDELNLDAIIVARGGGSVEDLMPFNDERLCRCVANAKTPIISAVGHETDYTICDMVADKRCLTPTAAGELVAYSTDDAKELVSSLLELGLQKIQLKESNLSKSVINSFSNLQNIITYKIDSKTQKLNSYLHSVDNQINRKLLQKQNEYVILNEKLTQIGKDIDQKTAVHVYRDGKKMFGLFDVNMGDNITLQSNSIEVNAKVTSKTIKDQK